MFCRDYRRRRDGGALRQNTDQRFQSAFKCFFRRSRQPLPAFFVFC